MFLFVVFRALIPAELARDYLAGAILLGAAPCTAMVFVWSHLTEGDAAYTVVQTTTIVSVLVKVPVMLTLVRIANKTQGWFANE
jgi:ACR3 family arsenite transporter